MPLRLLVIPQFLCNAVEAVILGAALGWNTFWLHASLISDDDWAKITGPHGVAFIAVVAVIVLWINKIGADKTRASELAEHDRKEDVRREQEEIAKEKRHQENLKSTKAYAEEMQKLAVESMKVTMKVEHTLSKLVSQLNGTQQVEVVNTLENPVPTHETTEE